MQVNWSDWFVYDETSPSCLRWKVDRTSGRNHNQVHVKAGDVAGCVNSSGYYQVKLNNKLISCHVIIAEMVCGFYLTDKIVDHKDRDKLNNRFWNLRAVPNALNMRNTSKRVDNTSGVTGVSKIGNGCGQFYWSARCEGLDGKFLQKRYSINKLGDDVAFNLACDWRKNMIEELNKQGAGYTLEHGT
jgi:hypothetical protein